jgi:hypothetical protein
MTAVPVDTGAPATQQPAFGGLPAPAAVPLATAQPPAAQPAATAAQSAGAQAAATGPLPGAAMPASATAGAAAAVNAAAAKPGSWVQAAGEVGGAHTAQRSQHTLLKHPKQSLPRPGRRAWHQESAASVSVVATASVAVTATSTAPSAAACAGHPLRSPSSPAADRAAGRRHARHAPLLACAPPPPAGYVPIPKAAATPTAIGEEVSAVTPAKRNWEVAVPGADEAPTLTATDATLGVFADPKYAPKVGPRGREMRRGRGGRGGRQGRVGGGGSGGTRGCGMAGGMVVGPRHREAHRRVAMGGGGAHSTWQGRAGTCAADGWRQQQLAGAGANCWRAAARSGPHAALVRACPPCRRLRKPRPLCSSPARHWAARHWAARPLRRRRRRQQLPPTSLPACLLPAAAPASSPTPTSRLWPMH